MKMSETKRQSVKQYVTQMIKWYRDIKYSRDSAERTFNEAKYEFSQCMEQYFDKVATEDNKIEIPVTEIKNCKKLIVTRITPSEVTFDIPRLKKLLSKKEQKLVIQKNYQVTNWPGLFELLKESGVDFKEFLKYVSITETVRDKQLDKLVELGAIDEEEVKKCSSVRLKSSYYKLTEK